VKKYYLIRDHLNVENLLSPRQFGFRQGCSTDQLVFQLSNLFKIMMTKKESKFISIAALDIKKAFDSVNHLLLLDKLNTVFYFQPKATLLLENHLSNRYQSLKYDHIISSKKLVSTGVPLGSIL
jgi:retron-type reverse transcriptase